MIDTLCIGSGGLKGLSFIAALKYLEEQKYLNLENINIFAGISVGSIICFFLVIGYTIDELYILAKELNYNEIIPELDLDSLLNNLGFNNGEKIMLTIANIAKKKINNSEITFLELYNLTNKEINIATTNFTKNCERVFNYKTTPNVSVLLAIRMSISVPFLYTPVLFENDYYIDGALTNNDEVIKNNNPETTLIVCCDKYIPNKKLSLQELLIGSIYILSDQINKNNYKKNCLTIKDIAEIPIYTDLNSDIIELYFLKGVYSSKKFLTNKLN